MTHELIFLKLGGSLLTDKAATEALRTDALARLAGEIATAREQRPALRLVLGHGSGSFGHVAAARYGTRHGARTSEEWYGFAAVSDAAARLNRAVVGALLVAGVPGVSLQPSASAVCDDGRIVELAAAPVAAALDAGIVPVIYGDVAFDRVRGATIISTEEVMVGLAPALRPSWLLLAGETDGVYDAAGQVVPLITADGLPGLLPALGGSRGTDVTGGMEAKVREMLALTAAAPDLRVRIFNGLRPGILASLLADPTLEVGTLLR
jgi:isopentenyl phosphate kinase